MGRSAHPFTGFLAGRAAIVLSCGPSIAGQFRAINLGRLAGAYCLGVNETAFRLGWPQAAVVYDWPYISTRTRLVQSYGGAIYAPAHYVRRGMHNLWPIEISNDGLAGLNDTFINGVFANAGGAGLAISVAWAMGADPILLCGFDFTVEGDGYRHWYSGRPSPNVQSLETVREILESLAPIAGDRILNCSPDSRLGGFRRGDLETELGRLDQG